MFLAASALWRSDEHCHRPQRKKIISCLRRATGGVRCKQVELCISCSSSTKRSHWGRLIKHMKVARNNCFYETNIRTRWKALKGSERRITNCLPSKHYHDTCGSFDLQVCRVKKIILWKSQNRTFSQLMGSQTKGPDWSGATCYRCIHYSNTIMAQ